jgi:hypothetical protein
MDYWHPDRPRDERTQWPYFVSPDGASRGIIPALYAEPVAPGKWRVWGHLNVGGAAFREYWLEFDLPGLMAFFQRWEQAPEAAIAELGWRDSDWQPRAARPPTRNADATRTSLADLGLD